MTLGIIVAGVVGALALSMVQMMAPRMGMPEMDIVAMLSTMFGKANRMMGWMMHLVMGIVFAYIYTLVGFPGTLVTALLYGAVHWVIAGLMMAAVPMMHAGIKSGDVEAPGMWMMNNGGMMAFVGGLIGHMIFALVVFFVVGLF